MAKIYGDEKTAKDELAKIKALPWKEKFPYIWEYYKIWIIGTILVVAMTVSISLSVIENSKPVLISGMLVNNFTSQENESLFEQNFTEYMGQNEDDVNLDLSTDMYLHAGGMDETTYNTVQKIAIQVAARDLDFIASDESVVHYYCNANDPDDIIYMDLSTILPDDIFSMLESQDRILYSTDANGNRFPAAVDVTGTRFYEDAQIISTYSYLGCMVTAPHKQNFVNLIRYAFDLPLPEGTDPTAEG